MTMQELYDETLIGLAKGKNTAAALSDLMNKGVPEAQARMIVAEAAKVKSEAFRKAGLQAAGQGAIYVAVGLAITIGTFALDMPIFFVAWGPVIFGGWQMLKGLYQAATA